MDICILSDILRRDIVGLHGKAMFSSSRYCGYPNVYSRQQYGKFPVLQCFPTFGIINVFNVLPLWQTCNSIFLF